MLPQRFGRKAALRQLVQNQLRPGRHHKILLVDAQQLAVARRVVGIEETRQAVRDVAFVKVDALRRGGGRVGNVEQVQPPGRTLLRAGDGDVVEHGVQVEPAERHGVAPAGGQQPAFGRQPGVGLLALFVFAEFLAEQPVMVVEPHAVAGQAQRGDGIEEAGGQPPQPAVAQGGFRLIFLEVGQRTAHRFEQVPHRFKQAQRQQIVAEQLAHEELGRKIVELAPVWGFGRGGARGGKLLRQRQQRLAEFGVGAGFGRFGKAGGGHGGQPLFEFVRRIEMFHVRSLPVMGGVGSVFCGQAVCRLPAGNFMPRMSRIQRLRAGGRRPR